MKLNQKKKEELERIAWFTGKNVKDFGDDEINEYFDWSERGIGNGGRLSVMKQKVGMTLKMWEESLLAQDSSWIGYYHLVRDEHGVKIPRHIVDFIKKEMFEGVDAKVIENAYNEL